MITPPVGGTRWNGYHSRHRSNALLFLVAAVFGSSALGVVAGFSNRWNVLQLPAVRNVGLLVIAIACVVYAMREFVRKPLRVPSRSWLVPRRWGNIGDRGFAITFGVLLGGGFFNILSFVGLHVLMLWCALSEPPWQSALIVSAFGAMRGLPVLLTAKAISEHSYSAYMPLGINQGYASADASILRPMRILSLLGSSVVLLASLT